MNIFIFSDNATLLPEMLGGANKLVGTSGGSIAAIIIGSESEAMSAASMGADKVYWLGEIGNRIIDDFVPTLNKLIMTEKPAAFLVAATTRGKAVAGRVAAALDMAAIVNAKEIKVVDGSFQVRHIILGGAVIRVEQPLGGTLIATVRSGVFTKAVADTSRSDQLEHVEFVEPVTQITKLESKPKKSNASNIGAAKIVVGAGRGFATKEDLGLARGLADALGGEVGYSRPVTEGNPPFAEGEPYIGVSGIQLKPELYIAVGISGQTQHMVGVNESRVIVCINKDPRAPMFRYSDYGIAGDLYEIVPELTRALNEK
ncbi:MAG: electron transfer flavoprotein subunit alpha/FixB family protein [Dehalobacter sp.]|nr:electron transfer flavoprotein subunit alpha/FixB family protein [Dehalobacter sp.]